MPKVKALIRRDPRETEVILEILGVLAAAKIDRKELAKLTGINISTLNLRMRDVGSMRLSELWKIQDVRKRVLS